MTRAAIVVAGLAPALAWYGSPAAPILVVAIAALAIAAALHGLGRVVGVVIGDPDAPVALAIAWGLAGYLAIGGTLAALGRFDHVGQRVVLVAGTAVGAAWWARRSAAWSWRRARTWRPTLALVPPALAIAVVALHVVGAAGTWLGGFSDGAGHLLGPLTRLDHTGALDDAVGLPRTSGLGGNVILTSLASGFDDWRMAHAIDRGLGLALTLALAFAGARRGPTRVVTLFAIVALASATPDHPIDLAPRWTLVALVFALHQTLGRSAVARGPAAALLLAAALASLRHPGLGVVVVVLVATLAPPGADRRRRGGGAIAIVALALGGYLIAAMVAAARAPASPAVVATLAHGAPVRLALWAAIAAVGYALAMLASRDHRDRALTVTLTAVAAAVAGAGPLSPSTAMAWLVVQPLAIAALLLLVGPALALAPGRGPRSVTVVAVVAIVLTLATTRFPTGRPPLSWEDRLGRLVDAGRALGDAARGPDTPEARAYADALRRLPTSARVGLWVERADLIDYRHHQLVDLRSAAAAACVDGVPASALWWRRRSATCRALEALLPRLDLDYLIVSPSALPRPDAWVFRPMCRLFAPRDCVDPITRFVGRDRLIAVPDLAVIDLTGG